MNWWLLLTCWLAFLAPAAQAGESVLFSMTTSDAHALVPVSKTEVLKTEIFAVDPETGKQRLVFSDANAHFFLLPGGAPKGGIVAVGGRIFAPAIEPVQTAAGTPAFDPGAPEAIYELSTDGSGKARKVFDIESGDQRSNFRDLFLNSSGSKIGNTNYIDGKTYLFIHETATGKLLRKTYLKYGSVEKLGWRYGSVVKIGWMPDDKRIFFTIEMAGDSDDASWTTPSSPVGTYVMSEDADTAERLAPEAALHAKLANLRPSNEMAAVLIGALPDGGYLLSDLQYAPTAGHPGTYFYALDLAKKTQKVFPLQMDGDPGSLHLSHSGNRLALTATQKEYQKQPKFTAISTLSVWIVELGSSKQWKLLSFPPHDETHGNDGPWINLIGWLDDQWKNL